MLIRCTECGRMVSDEAFVCPGCGRDVRHMNGSCSTCKYKYGRPGCPGEHEYECWLGPKGYPCLGYTRDEYADMY